MSSSRLISSTWLGVNPYFIERVLFRLFVTFVIKSLGLIFFPNLFCILLLFNGSFSNSLIFCSAVKALTTLILVLNIVMPNSVSSFVIHFTEILDLFVASSLVYLFFYQIRRCKTALIFFKSLLFFHWISINFRCKNIHEEQTVSPVDSRFSKKSNVCNVCT